MRNAIAETGLDLSGVTVLTEAASGSYVVTPVIAALSNARHVYAVTRSSSYGSAAEIIEQTMNLASMAGVADRITISEEVPFHALPDVNLVTNSGHLRPITSHIINRLATPAVIALMFESWEFRPHDLDVSACRQRGVAVVGVNEHHPAVDVFSYLGPLAVKLLHDAGLPVYRNRIGVLCDNQFDEPIMRALSGIGAEAHCLTTAERLQRDSWDAILVALQPTANPRIGAGEAAYLSSVSGPGTLVAQFWGDVDRDALQSANMRVWPPMPPKRGHMAILLSSIGPEPIVRLQTGGLKAAEWILRGGVVTPDCFAQPVYLESICVQEHASQ
ncbi:hypothetical protein ACXR0O_21805 [Verrucomicrobiota bacterium sgz303538]